jgi:hypothetical protein
MSKTSAHRSDSFRDQLYNPPLALFVANALLNTTHHFRVYTSHRIDIMVKVRTAFIDSRPACPDVMATPSDDGSTPSRRSTARSQRSSRAGSLLRDRLWRPPWWSRRTRPRWCRCRRSPARPSPVVHPLDAAAQGLCCYVSTSRFTFGHKSICSNADQAPFDSPSRIFGIRFHPLARRPQQPRNLAIAVHWEQPDSSSRPTRPRASTS